MLRALTLKGYTKRIAHSRTRYSTRFSMRYRLVCGMRSPIMIIRWIGLALLAIGLLFPSKMLVHRLLPEQYVGYLPHYLQGFLVVKVLLIIGGILTILLAAPLNLTFGGGKQAKIREVSIPTQDHINPGVGRIA